MCSYHSQLIFQLFAVDDLFFSTVVRVSRLMNKSMEQVGDLIPDTLRAKQSKKPHEPLRPKASLADYREFTVDTLSASLTRYLL
jgi:hypothetical protein